MGKNVFNTMMSEIDNQLDNYASNVLGFRHFRYIMEKPIGLLSKEYGFSVDALMHNMGNNLSLFDGYGTPIGMTSDPYMNLKLKPAWYYFDEKKNITSNYFEYISLAYSDELNENHFIDNDLKMLQYNPNDLITNYDYVGAVRHYNGNTNPNGYDDTKMGLINGFYLDGTLYASKVISEERQEKNQNGITQGAYSSFGLGDGKNSLMYGYGGVEGRVATQSELIGDIIPWSTTDFNYNSNVIGGGGIGNINKVDEILSQYGVTDRNSLDVNFNDEVQSTNLSSLYRGYGNFYSITYSLGLLHASSKKTQDFIAKSMYGYNLLSDIDVNFDYENGDNTDHTRRTHKKYYVSNGTRGTNYIDMMTSNDVEFIKYNNNVVRTKLIDAGNDNLWSTRTLYTYGEMEGNALPIGQVSNANTWNEGIAYGKHVIYTEDKTKKKDIIKYTNDLFQKGKLDTLISRFHGDEFASVDEVRANRDLTQTAISKYGVSHGRNLLRKDHADRGKNSSINIGNGYDNPYCRVWTYHHQYGTFNETIRPFGDKNGGDLKNTEVNKYRSLEGLNNLSKYGAKTPMGLVKIAPTMNDSGESNNDIRKCMFSLENLAWKGEKNYFVNHEDQKGPLGGRIMWFPPYGLRFNEDSKVQWNGNQFINRGENIYTYVNTERSGSLSFKLLIDHPSIVNSYTNKTDSVGDVDDTESYEQQLLRFFAGCEILEAKNPQTTKQEEKEEEKTPLNNVKTEVIQIPTTVYGEINFFVFYPNNYSGEDNEPSDNIKPMEYLANGIGASLICENGKTVDFGTSLDKQYQGYEMRDKGITPQGEYTGTCGDDNKLIGSNYVTQKKMGKNGKYRYWGYRVDDRVANEVLYPVNNNWDYNYFDTTSYQLNSIGYSHLLKAHTSMKEVYDNGDLYSFAEVFCAIEGEKAENILKDGNKDLYDPIKVKQIRKLIEDFTVVDVEVNGFASSHGYTKSNEQLNRNRGKSVVKWLAHKNSKFSVDMFNFSMNKIGEELGHHDSRDFSAKVWRCAKVCIKLQKEDIIEKKVNIDPPIENVLDSDVKIDNINHYDNVSDRANQGAVDVTRRFNIDNEYDLISKFGGNISKMQLISAQNQMEYNKAVADTSVISSLKNGNTIFLNQSGAQCYKDEYKFFKDLKRNEPLLHNKLVEKLRYFDPAFHSITPEGFNSRLTFLHQCTRQGNTYSNSDLGQANRTANNLAFGRPPICVLRIGDFFNTKILINNLSITYDDTTWDLNDEGIGIMPMMADVTITFNFLGGSDISGPINRLQNALSFNYYANTSVYDNRSEGTEYDENGNMTKLITQ